MRQFSSGSKTNILIEAFRNVPPALRSAVSALVTDKIYWFNEGPRRSYWLSHEVEIIAEHIGDEFQIDFKEGKTLIFNTKIKKWPDNWLDEESGKDKMKM